MPTSHEILHFTPTFVLSAGTITVDPATKHVLLVHSTATSEYFLPKGRLNIGESPQSAAVRETREETGAEVTLLPLRNSIVATGATVTADVKSGSDTAEGEVWHTEMFAMTRRIRGDVEKTIFWFIATGDSGGRFGDVVAGEGEEGFVGVWVEFGEVEGTVTFENEREMIWRAIGVVERHADM